MLGWRDTKVTYLLKAEDTGTRLTVRQDGFANLGNGAAQHTDGWQRFLGFPQLHFAGLKIPHAA